jgi:hypothetical protein
MMMMMMMMMMIKQVAYVTVTVQRLKFQINIQTA